MGALRTAWKPAGSADAIGDRSGSTHSGRTTPGQFPLEDDLAGQALHQAMDAWNCVCDAGGQPRCRRQASTRGDASAAASPGAACITFNSLPEAGYRRTFRAVERQDGEPNEEHMGLAIEIEDDDGGREHRGNKL